MIEFFDGGWGWLGLCLFILVVYAIVKYNNKYLYKEVSTKYFVEGGEYTSTDFNELVSDMKSFGPFETYKEAYDKWLEESWHDVDNCHAKYKIVKKHF